MNTDHTVSIEKKAAREGFGLAGFRLSTQLFSWAITIIVARLLSPEDYGFMEMATILTGYVGLFSELGLGAAIIQREEIKDEELSSLFWFMIFWGFVLALICIMLAYPTVSIFHEKRILRVAQSVSLLYIIGAFLIVPLNILHRELRFKTVGFIDSISVVVSCIAMVIIAKRGGGVWTLIGGHIIRQFVGVILIYSVISWKPKLHFAFSEIKSYAKFGLTVAGSNSLNYIYTKSDRFFGGMALGSNSLGYYSLALQLASIPTDKAISLINSVSFPVFSRYQKKYGDFNQFYLKLVRLIAFISLPVYLGGIFAADQLIPFVLGPKWLPLIFPFKVLCIAQVITSITTPNALANNAQGRPLWNLNMGIINVLLLPFSFYVASKYGLNALAIPWITAYPMLRLGFTWITLRKLDIALFDYLKNMKHPVFATISMLLALILAKYVYFNSLYSSSIDLKTYLLFIITIGVISYALYIMTFQRSLVIYFLNIRKN
jgi:O-antigen/teichoic acid export membrane protein